jgi:hypothetical protein
MELQQQQRAREAACMRRSRASQRSIRKCLWSVRPPLGEASWHQGGRASLRTKKAGGAKKEQRQGSRATRMTLNFPWSVKSVSVWCRPCLTPTPAVAFIDPFPFHGTRALGPFLGRANSECRSVLSESVSAQLLSCTCSAFPREVSLPLSRAHTLSHGM